MGAMRARAARLCDLCDSGVRIMALPLTPRGGSVFLFGCILPVAEFRLYFDLEHSSTHSVDFWSEEPAR
jgi:hypothetical protein